MRNPFRRRATVDQSQEVRTYDPAGVPPAFAEGAPHGVLGMLGATRTAALFGAGRILATGLAGLPIQTYRKLPDGSRTQVPNPPLLDPPGGWRNWVFRAVTSMVYRGNAIGLVTSRDRLEYPTAVRWLNPDDVFVNDANLVGPGSFDDPQWYWRGNLLPTDDIVHIPWFVVPERVWGLSPMGAFAMSLNTSEEAQQHTYEWFRNGGTPPGVFANEDSEIDQQTAQVVKTRISQAIRSRQPIVHGRGWRYTPLSVTANEAKFVDTLRMSATDIAVVYGINPGDLGGNTGDSMTYANEEGRSIRFQKDTLLPWQTTMESALNLLTPRGQYVKFNIDSLVRPDTMTRYQSHRTARDIGLMSVNEIRALEDLAPIPGDEGDDYSPLAVQTKEATPTAVPPLAPVNGGSGSAQT